MKRIIYILFLLLAISLNKAHAQLEKVIVENYYVSDSLDATDTIGGGIAIGSKTYRIYIDLLPGCKLQKIYGDANHALIFKSTAPFFNNIADGQTFAKDIAKNRYLENTVALDTWLTLGQTTRSSSRTYFGVLKSNDHNGSFIGGVNNDGGSSSIPVGLLNNDDPLAGIPLTNADGMDTLVNLPSNWADNGIAFAGIDSTIFGSLVPGTQFISNHASLQNSGVMGVNPDTNQIIVAQLTTKGDLSFELNIEVVDQNGTVIRYVANDSILLPGEILNRYLKYPFAQICGCPDPHYLNYIADRDCDNLDSCKTLVVFGCTDSNACNFDPDANFNLPELCCYPGYCNDRDISIVCPSITQSNRSFNIYPNPAEKQLSLNFTSEQNDKIYYIIYDSFGNFLSRESVEHSGSVNSTQINLADLKPGLYMLRLVINDQSESKFFMKF